MHQCDMLINQHNENLATDDISTFLAAPLDIEYISTAKNKTNGIRKLPIQSLSFRRSVHKITGHILRVYLYSWTVGWGEGQSLIIKVFWNLHEKHTFSVDWKISKESYSHLVTLLTYWIQLSSVMSILSFQILANKKYKWKRQDLWSLSNGEAALSALQLTIQSVMTISNL